VVAEPNFAPLFPMTPFLGPLRTLVLAVSLLGPTLAHAYVALPVPADERIANTQIRVSPDRAGWTYKPDEPVKFHVSVVWDQQPLEGVTIKYKIGPEMLEAPERTAVVPAAGLTLDGGTMTSPGFLRCVVTAQVGGKSFRGLATAGFSPEKIVPTQTPPADFEAFWAAQKAALAQIPIDARLALQPDLCTPNLGFERSNSATRASLASLGGPRSLVNRICRCLRRVFSPDADGRLGFPSLAARVARNPGLDGARPSTEGAFQRITAARKCSIA